MNVNDVFKKRIGVKQLTGRHLFCCSQISGELSYNELIGEPMIHNQQIVSTLWKRSVWHKRLEVSRCGFLEDYRTIRMMKLLAITQVCVVLVASLRANEGKIQMITPLRYGHVNYICIYVGCRFKKRSKSMTFQSFTSSFHNWKERAECYEL